MHTRSTVMAAIFLVMTGTAPAKAQCIGDCGSDGDVTVDELIVGVNIALGSAQVAQCSAMDANADGDVTIDELITAVSHALNGCAAGFVGNYAGIFDLNGRTGGLQLSVDTGGHATGNLIVDGAAFAARFAAAVTFPAGGFSVSLSGNVDSGGTFQVTGSFVDGNGQNVDVNIGGTLPAPSKPVSITAHIGSDTFSGTLNTGTVIPTRTPTPGPTPTPPTGGCADGIFAVTFSDPVDTNADTASLTLGKVTALDQFDPSSQTYIWVISGANCKPVFGQPLRGLAIQGIAETGRIQPGTYAIGASQPPFLTFLYSENNITTDPTKNYIHAWNAVGGTLVLEDAGGGALRFHASGVTMAKALVFQGATGTFTLDINGSITAITHN
ncbi:MAG TPA: hypothetical protein VMT89_10775 [Candidatus Acidoferrales bacterium]|nr:hypothetical protein [Candidatus Acidoferrales bacterium]